MKLGELQRISEGLTLTVLPAIEGKKLKKQDYIFAIGDYYAQTDPRRGQFGFEFIRKMESPMLAQRENYLKEKEQKALRTSDLYYWDTKEDGVRQLITYHPDEGFDFYSRGISVADCLPISYKNNIFLTVHRPTAGDWKGVFDRPFILDCELVSNNPEVNTIVEKRGGVVTETVLQAVASLLGLAPEFSIEIQKDGCQLEFRSFTCIYDGEDIREQDEHQRRDKVEVWIKQLQLEGFAIQPTKYVIEPEARADFLENIFQAGGEGVIVKRWDTPYISKNSRGRDRYVKIKRTTATMTGEDVDAFVSGYLAGKEESRQHQVGVLEFSILLDTLEGQKNHIIAYVGGLTEAERVAMTRLDEFGQPHLKDEYYNRVASIQGQAFSSRSMRMKHARIIRDKDGTPAWRPDRSWQTCTMTEDELKAQIL